MSMSQVTIWRLLKIKPTKDEKLIKRAYKQRAKELHPDVSQGDSDVSFSDLTEAYEQALELARQIDPARTVSSNVDPFADMSVSGSQAEVEWQSQMNGLFRDEAAIQSHAQGRSIFEELQISFEEAFSGTVKLLHLQIESACQRCEGAGNLRWRCEICSATGRIGGGECWNCSGLGWLRKTACSACEGAGSLSRREDIKIRIPAGSQTGRVLKVMARGHEGLKNRGDLSVRLTVLAHQEFAFGRGNDLLVTREIDIATAGLGGHVEVSLPEGGSYRLPVPPMVSEGREIILPGYGWPHMDGTSEPGRGDLRVQVRLSFHGRLNDRMRTALRAYQEAAQETPPQMGPIETPFDGDEEA